MNGLDLFTGIGGIALGLEPWVKPVAYCEIDPCCVSILRKRMESNLNPGIVFDDVRALRRGHISEPIDIITGGFPCQDLSVAGKRAGLDGERSGLYKEVVRLVAEIVPAFVFLENVPGVIKYLSRIREDFAALGYAVRACRLSAASIGAAHIRDRVFMLAADVERVELWQQPRRSGGPSRAEEIQPPPPPPPKRATPNTHGQGKLQSQGQESEEWRRPDNGIVTSWRDRADEGVSLLVHGLPVRMVDQRLTGNACIPAQAREAFKHLMGFV